jgi:hypothetical protein
MKEKINKNKTETKEAGTQNGKKIKKGEKNKG